MNRIAMVAAVAVVGVGAFATGRASVEMPGIVTLTPDSVLQAGTSGRIELCHRNATIKFIEADGAVIKNVSVDGGQTAFVIPVD